MSAALQPLYENHPAAELFPMMNDEDLLTLAESIKKSGLLEPIVLLEGKVLDGRNRLVACGIAGVEPRFENWKHAEMSPTLYVLAMNLERRQLTIGQRAAIAAESIPMLHEEARKRQGFRTDIARTGTLSSIEPEVFGRAKEIAAAQTGVSPSSVQRAIEVMTSDPEEFERVKKGEITVHAAHAKLKPRTGQCSVPECERRVDAAGMCEPHYRRTLANGSPTSSPIRPAISRADRAEKIRTMVAEGHNSEQIGESIGVRGQHVRDLAREYGIAMPEFSAGGKRKIDACLVIRETVQAAENAVVGLDIVDGKLAQLDTDSIPAWIESLDNTIRALSKLLRQLRKVSENGK